MVAADTEGNRSIALAYEVTEEARELLVRAGYGRLAPPRRAVSEAAYYLSDTLDPDDRLQIAAAAGVQAGRAHEEPAADAFALLEDVAAEVEHLLRGPDASSELRIGLRAIRSALGDLACDVSVDGERGSSAPLAWRRDAMSRG
jgi:hypothetical protein